MHERKKLKHRAVQPAACQGEGEEGTHAGKEGGKDGGRSRRHKHNKQMNK